MAEAIEQYGAKNILFMDESGMAEGDTYERGWSLKGSRLLGARTGLRRKRINFMSAIRSDERVFLEPWCFEGSCNRTIVERWVEALFKTLPRQADLTTVIPHVLVMDNASYHKGGEIAEIVDKFNGKILYLPPYSPDFNPIEQCWFVLKNTAKKLRSQGVTLNDAIDHAFNSM